MFRLTTIAIILIAANISFAGDLLPIVFEDASIMQLKNDREHYKIVFYMTLVYSQENPHRQFANWVVKKLIRENL